MEVDPTPFDSLVVRCLGQELGAFAGDRVGRVGMPDRLSVALGLRQATLVISVDPELPAFFPVPDLTPPKPATPFANLLAARLEGALLASVATVPGERVAVITFERKSRLFDPETFRLVAEFYGTRGDVLLTGGDFTVLGVLRGLRAAPGDTYVMPLPTVDVTLPGSGAPSLLRREWDHLALCGAAADELWQALWSEPGRFSPVSVSDLSPPAYPLPLTHLGAATPLPSLSDTCASDWAMRYRRRDEERTRKALHDHQATLLARAERKLRQQEAELDEAADARRYRIWGEVLLSRVADVRPGLEKLPYTDWETGEEGEVPLPSGLSAAEAAQKYFATYRRLRSRQERLAAEIARTRKAVDAARRRLAELAAPPPTGGRDPFTPQALPPKAPAPSQDALPGRLFRTSTGRRIRVGRSAAENERLWRLAKSRDIWLHAKDIAGSHVILAAEGGVGEKEIAEAALLAAYFSKARRSAHVAVDWTERRHVRKPKGSAPGFVLYDHESTVFADPTSPEVASLLRSEHTARS